MAASTELAPHVLPNLGDKLTRDTFISPDHVQNAIKGGRMYIYDVNSGQPVQTTLPIEYVQSGTIPEGYCVECRIGLAFDYVNSDFAFDPATAVRALMDSGISAIEQLPPGLLDEMKATINNSQNLTIVPIELYAAKLQSVLSAIQSMDRKEKDE